MRLTVDNLDGLGAFDYSGAIDRSQKLEIVRTLNAPSIVKGMFCVAGTTLAPPVRRARLSITADSGALLFTGYLATEPMPVYAGVASAGPVYRLAFRAVSDEASLDRSAAKTVGSTTHVLNDGDGSLDLAALHTAQVRELANDVTLTGALEPTTYWQEIFQGDGTTVEFDLAGEPAAPALGHAVLLTDNFQAGTLNPRRWVTTDPGSHLQLGAGGLVLNGGNGFDGQTTLVSNTAVELGGTLVVELRDVLLNASSAGVLGGFYSGTVVQANCVAGFNVRQSSGNTLLTPMVDGVEVGSSATITPGHSYTLRLHLHCAELLRTRQTFSAMVDVGATAQMQQFGGGEVAAALAVVFELRDQGQSSNTPVTILYDGSAATSPATASFCLVNSVQLSGSLGSVQVTRTGTAWIRSTDSAGAMTTRLAGLITSGVDCTVQASVTGKVTFYPGRVPVPGEYVTVLYRGRARAVARLADAASLATEAAGGGGGSARWLGKVEKPAARSSEDCENAAQAVLASSTSRAAAISGSYVSVNPPLGSTEVWPGDVLALTANGGSLNVIVRQVTIDEGGAAPEALTYRIAFANDWAEGLGMTLSEAIAADAVLPETALELAPGQTPASPARVLPGLQQMTVIGFTGAGASSGMTVDAGVDPPAGGGFEVRRSNGSFGSGTGAGASGDLVLRSPVRGFSIPRTMTGETFYVRMYDGSSPPLYSRVASAVVTHVPLQ